MVWVNCQNGDGGGSSVGDEKAAKIGKYWLKLAEDFAQKVGQNNT